MPNSPQDPNTFALLTQLLRQHLTTQTTIISTTTLNHHQDYLVLLATLRHPTLDVIIKLAGPNAPYPSPFDRTALFHRLVATHTSIPISEILAVDVSCQEWPWRYLITTCLPGQEWAVVQPQLSQQELHDAYQQFGQAVAQLHTIPFSNFGEVEPDGTVPSQGDYLAALKQRTRRRIKHPRLADLFLQVVDDHLDLFSAIRQPALCHEDLHRHNILFDQVQGRWQLSTILDFVKAWAGHHESDLARLELWSGMTGEGFWPAYREICPLAEEYEQRRPIYQLFWCLEFAQSTPKHFEDTRNVCQQLGIPPITDF